MLLAQISDLHVVASGTLLFDRIDTPGFLRRAVVHLNALDPRPDFVLITGDLFDHNRVGATIVEWTAEQLDRAKSLKSSQVAVISKPFTLEDIRASVRKLLA